MEQQKKIDLLADRMLKRVEFKRNFGAFMTNPSSGWKKNQYLYNIVLETKKARLYLANLAINEQFKQINN